jgi:hypothetical protein
MCSKVKGKGRSDESSADQSGLSQSKRESCFAAKFDHSTPGPARHQPESEAPRLGDLSAPAPESRPIAVAEDGGPL